MLNKYLHYLPVILIALSCVSVNAQDSMNLTTLFTTVQERQIINANRYRKENKQSEKPKTIETVAAAGPEQDQEVEKVSQSYKISGISIDMDGSRIAWLNNRAYEHGATLDDGSKLRINNGAIKSVSITTPDGKQHTATSGETLAVTYVRALAE